MAENPEDPDVAPADEAPPGSQDTGEDLCPSCGGSGQQDGKACPDCGGTGRVTEAIGGG
jgi:DnaJ-class molecular chaperone